MTLRACAVLDSRVRRVLVSLAEAAQVGYSHFGRWQQRHNVAVLGSVARPPVQEHHGGTSTGSLVRKPESINGSRPIHIRQDSGVESVLNSATFRVRGSLPTWSRCP